MIKTIYIDDTETGRPVRFDYKECYMMGTKERWIEVYMVSGMRYKEDEYVGEFDSIKDLKEFANEYIFSQPHY